MVFLVKPCCWRTGYWISGEFPIMGRSHTAARIEYTAYDSMLQFLVIAVCRCAFNQVPHFCNPRNVFIRQRLLIDAR